MIPYVLMFVNMFFAIQKNFFRFCRIYPKWGEYLGLPHAEIGFEAKYRKNGIAGRQKRSRKGICRVAIK